MFFSSKKRIADTGLLRDMTDIHSHILYGVDDGMKTEEESLAALSYLAGVGVKHIYLTPHVMDPMIENYQTIYRQTFENLLHKAPVGIEIRLAAEYMLDAGFFIHLKEGLSTMADRHVLVETSYMAPPPDMENKLYEIVLEGYSPIIAHPERYVYMDDNDYLSLKHKGYQLQLNLFSLSGKYGKRADQVARKLILKGMYDFIGSDIHNLEIYKEEIRKIVLNKKEELMLRKLLENNHSLW